MFFTLNRCLHPSTSSTPCSFSLSIFFIFFCLFLFHYFVTTVCFVFILFYQVFFTFCVSLSFLFLSFSVGVASVSILWHGIALLILLLLSTWCNVAACVLVLWPQNLYLSRMKNNMYIRVPGIVLYAFQQTRRVARCRRYSIPGISIAHYMW